MPEPTGRHLLQRFPHCHHSTVVARPLTWFPPHRLYLGNPMDPPDLLSVDLSASRPTQHLGRAKSKSPSPRRTIVHRLARGIIFSGQP